MKNNIIDIVSIGSLNFTARKSGVEIYKTEQGIWTWRKPKRRNFR